MKTYLWHQAANIEDEYDRRDDEQPRSGTPKQISDLRSARKGVVEWLY